MIKMDAKFYGEIRKVKDDTVVPDDEWVCFLVKDNAFAAMLPKYREECENLGADAEQLAAVDRMIKRVSAWRAANPERLKVPDARGEKDVAGPVRYYLVTDATAAEVERTTGLRGIDTRLGTLVEAPDAVALALGVGLAMERLDRALRPRPCSCSVVHMPPCRFYNVMT